MSDLLHEYAAGSAARDPSATAVVLGDERLSYAELGRYIEAGFHTFILDIPPSREEIEHTGVAFERAGSRLG